MATSNETVSVLAAGATHTAPRRRDGKELWLSRDELRQVTGWELKPEGLCKDEICVPLPPGARDAVDGDHVCASRVWEALGRPVLHDAAHSAFFLGEAAEDRARALETLEAPDFELPDVYGKPHRLSDQRGKKVLLATWASW